MRERKRLPSTKVYSFIDYERIARSIIKQKILKTTFYPCLKIESGRHALSFVDLAQDKATSVHFHDIDADLLFFIFFVTIAHPELFYFS